MRDKHILNPGSSLLVANKPYRTTCVSSLQKVAMKISEQKTEAREETAQAQTVD